MLVSLDSPVGAVNDLGSSTGTGSEVIVPLLSIVLFSDEVVEFAVVFSVVTVFVASLLFEPCVGLVSLAAVTLPLPLLVESALFAESVGTVVLESVVLESVAMESVMLMPLVEAWPLPLLVESVVFAESAVPVVLESVVMESVVLMPLVATLELECVSFVATALLPSVVVVVVALAAVPL